MQKWVLSQLRMVQRVSDPGQSATVLHCPQTPLTHIVPPPCEQVVPSGFDGCAGAPVAQTSSVQGLTSSAGASLLSWTEVVPPRPSHCAFWQLPVASGSAAIPAWAFEKPQVAWFPQMR